MLIEIGAPAILPLGVAQFSHDNKDRTGLLGITLQHPPILMAAQAHPQLDITGARAQIAQKYAQRYLTFHQLRSGVEIDIELAIPANLGLGSEQILGLTTARALAWLNKHSVDDTAQLAQAIGLDAHDSLAVCGFDQGGILFVESRNGSDRQEIAATILRREVIDHPDDEAWVFVLVFPPMQQDYPQTTESDRLKASLEAASFMEPAQGNLIIDHVCTAIKNDDVVAFGQGLQDLRRMNETALAQISMQLPLPSKAREVLEIMQANGAVAWGQSPTGFGLYGLVKGKRASIILQKKLSDHLGFFGGRVMATITDNRGAHHIIMEDVSLREYVPANMRR